MTEQLYMRKISFTAGGAIMELPLNIKFSVPFGEESEVDTIEIQVYNLKDATINSLVTNSKALLIAGYRDNSGAIFEGTLKKVESKWEGLDKIVTFKCIDSTDSYTKDVVKKTYGRNTKASLILKEIAQKAGLKIGDIDLPVDFVYRSGKTINGKIQKVLNEIGKDCKAKLYVNKGSIFVRKPNKATTLGLLISKETGLIDEPEIVEEEQVDKAGSKLKNDKKKVKGYKLRSLLNHQITTDVTVVVESRKVKGTFRVTQGEHKCEGEDSSTYYTEFEVVPV